MSLPQAIRAHLQSALTNPLSTQLAPFLVLFLIPCLVLLLFNNLTSHYTQRSRSYLLWSAAMVLESLGLGLPWNWTRANGLYHSSSSAAASSSSVNGHERKKSKKKNVRTRVQQQQQVGVANGHARPDSSKSNGVDDGYYPGLVNISGTYCFMNSTLQAMASLSYLQPHIDAIHAKAVALDVPSPVIDALQDLLHQLNTPSQSQSSLRPMDLISSLSSHSPTKHNSLFSSREHQDAQELFQLLSECIKDECVAVDREGIRDRGLGGFGGGMGADGKREDKDGNIGGGGGNVKSVFDGLTANRRSCMECGYTEAVMHFAFDNWQLAVPRMSASCPLETCLADYTRLELLTDCICRKCSLLATHKRLSHEAEKLAEALRADMNPSTSKKRRAKEAVKLERKVKLALEEGRIEDDLKGVRMDKVVSRASTKQAMIARPPPVLALHLNRSMHYGQYAAKNNVRILFPEILDLTPFTTSGNLSTVPSIPISTPPPSIPRSTTPTPATYATPRTIYRLSAVVCHYGQHSFGHYVCYRRKPRRVGLGDARFDPPRLVDPLGCECEKCVRYGPVRDEDGGLDDAGGGGNRPGGGWLRISDESVRECGIESVLQEGSGAFMLYYERVLQPRPGIYPLAGSPRSSEETLKPIIGSVSDASLSTCSLSSVGNGLAVGLVGKEDRKARVLGPRVVRSVAPGRGRSLSATPSDRASSSTVISSSSSVGGSTPKREETPLLPLLNGDTKCDGIDVVKAGILSHRHLDIPSSLSASLPNLPPPASTPPPSVLTDDISSPSSSPSTSPPSSPPPLISSNSSSQPPTPHRVQSPQPLHPEQSQLHMAALSV